MSSAPLTADQMLAALAKWGIVPRFYKSDWRTHNRGNRGAGWGPVINGLLVHNFASDISDASSLAYLYNGDNARGMPGPLSQFAIDDAGTAWVIGWGRANHGGSGDPGFVDALAYDRLSLSSDYKPRTAGSVDMNARTYGVEMLYGKGPTQAQRDSVVRLAAALMDAHGYAATSVGGHRESTTQRSDPTGFQMGPLRAQVAALLMAGPGSTLSKPVAGPPATTPPRTTNPTPKEETMAISDADAQKIAAAVLGYKNPKVNGSRDVYQVLTDGSLYRDQVPAPNKNDKANPTWMGWSYLREIFLQGQRIEASNKALAAAVSALSKSQGLDPAKVQASIDAAVKDALAGIEITLTTS